MAFDYTHLRGRIREVCGTQETFANTLGISVSTLSLKLNNKAEWTQEEMAKTVSILGEFGETVNDYFFKPKV